MFYNIRYSFLKIGEWSEELIMYENVNVIFPGDSSIPPSSSITNLVNKQFRINTVLVCTFLIICLTCNVANNSQINMLKL